MNAFWLYKKTMTLGTPFIKAMLKSRLREGKEDPDRINERMGVPSLPRPHGPLIWIHVASVGEAQSVLRLINLILDQNQQLNILVTSVTRTSATLLADKLPSRAFHQYAPVDHPAWIRAFLDYWHPNVALWVESELWPVMLKHIKKRHIPAALLNAHMSPNSFKNWNRAPALLREMLSGFLVILAQSTQDAEFYAHFSPHSVVATDNIKYAARPLAYNEQDYAALKSAIGARPVWLYASTHDGEEELAARVHKQVAEKFPNLLTIIAPRHPERRHDIAAQLARENVAHTARGTEKNLPSNSDQVYIVDTMGELGLMYKLAPMAIVGRCFSKDGGGGHNPIEPALLDCAVLHGPAIQNMQELYDQMDDAGAALKIDDGSKVADTIIRLMSDRQALEKLTVTGKDFAAQKAGVMSRILDEIEPVFLEAHLPPPKEAA